ncbi:hypothetical protein ZWY2020_035884 [Hordeum vulgare]|nr:hypothetical protein ZWY2020_035884 [Hordeum vulgare]
MASAGRPPCRATAALLSAPIPLAPRRTPLSPRRAAPRLAAAAPVPLPARPARPSRECEAGLHGHHAKLNPFTGWEDMDRKAPLPGVYDDESGLLMLDGNAQEPSSGPINFVQFHRNGLLMLDAGLDKRLRVFQMDGKRNPMIQSIFVEDCPVHRASFLPGGSELSCSLLLELIQQGLLRWVELLLYWVQPEGQGDAAPKVIPSPPRSAGSNSSSTPSLDYATILKAGAFGGGESSSGGAARGGGVGDHGGGDEGGAQRGGVSILPQDGLQAANGERTGAPRQGEEPMGTTGDGLLQY